MSKPTCTTIKLSFDASNAILTIARPEVLNAVNLAFWQELDASLDHLETLDEVRVIIIAGEGRAFSAGADLKESSTRSIEQYEEYLQLLQHVTKRILSFPKPFIAAIHGHAIGSGIELALACDFRLAAKSSKIALPEARVSSSATGGTLLLLPRLIGAAKTRELLYLGDTIDADEALSIGLVHRSVSDEILLDAAKELGLSIAENSAESLRLIKRGLFESLQPQLDKTMAFEVRACLLAVSAKDREKAIERFSNK